MKTFAKKFSSILTIFFVVIFSISFAQPYPLYNNAPCDVKLQYEVWDSACDVCQWGSITVPGNGGSVNLPVCSGWCEICITITDIGGDSPSFNHTTLNCCHPVTPTGQTGTTSSSATCPSYGWSATQTGSNWTFN